MSEPSSSTWRESGIRSARYRPWPTGMSVLASWERTSVGARTSARQLARRSVPHLQMMRSSSLEAPTDVRSERTIGRWTGPPTGSEPSAARATPVPQLSRTASMIAEIVRSRPGPTDSRLPPLLWRNCLAGSRASVRSGWVAAKTMAATPPVSAPNSVALVDSTSSRTTNMSSSACSSSDTSNAPSRRSERIRCSGAALVEQDKPAIGGKATKAMLVPGLVPHQIDARQPDLYRAGCRGPRRQ